MLTPPPSKARKGKEADRKEAANETRAKLDLEDAVHDLLPVSAAPCMPSTLAECTVHGPMQCRLTVRSNPVVDAS